jgi:hypothetical protein
MATASVTAEFKMYVMRATPRRERQRQRQRQRKQSPTYLISVAPNEEQMRRRMIAARALMLRVPSASFDAHSDWR